MSKKIVLKNLYYIYLGKNYLRNKRLRKNRRKEREIVNRIRKLKEN
jgi:hypothetical protein